MRIEASVWMQLTLLDVLDSLAIGASGDGGGGDDSQLTSWVTIDQTVLDIVRRLALSFELNQFDKVKVRKRCLYLVTGPFDDFSQVVLFFCGVLYRRVVCICITFICLLIYVSATHFCVADVEACLSTSICGDWPEGAREAAISQMHLVISHCDK